MVKGFGSSGSGVKLQGKKKQTANEISGPISSEHIGHLSIGEKGGVQARNLPPAIQGVFQELDSGLKKMGMKGITKSEAIFLLQIAAEHEYARRENEFVKEQAKSPRSGSHILTLSAEQNSEPPLLSPRSQRKHKRTLSSSGPADVPKEDNRSKSPTRKRSVSNVKKASSNIESDLMRINKSLTELIEEKETALQRAREEWAKKMEDKSFEMAKIWEEFTAEEQSRKQLQKKLEENEAEMRMLYQKDKDQLEDLNLMKKRMEVTEEERGKINAELDVARKNYAEWKDKCASMEMKCAQLEHKVKELEFLSSSNSSNASTAKAQLENLQKQFQSRQANLEKQIEAQNQENKTLITTINDLKKEISNKDFAKLSVEDKLRDTTALYRNAKKEAIEQTEKAARLQQQLLATTNECQEVSQKELYARKLLLFAETQADKLRSELESANQKIQLLETTIEAGDIDISSTPNTPLLTPVNRKSYLTPDDRSIGSAPASPMVGYESRDEGGTKKNSTVTKVLLSAPNSPMLSVSAPRAPPPPPIPSLALSPPPSRPSPSDAPVSPRTQIITDLLTQIQTTGKELKKVENSTPENNNASNDLIKSLAAQLFARRQNMKQDTEESDEELMWS